MTTMNRDSIIKHPPLPYVVIRPEYLAICGGNYCAAAILSFFEHWHNVKLEHREQAAKKNEIARDHGLPPDQDEELWVYESQSELRAALLNLFSVKNIRAATDQLVEWGYLETRRNPIVGYDRKIQYLFVNIQVQKDVDSWLEASQPDNRTNRPNAIGRNVLIQKDESSQAIADHSSDHSSDLFKDSPLPPSGDERGNSIHPSKTEENSSQFTSLKDHAVDNGSLPGRAIVKDGANTQAVDLGKSCRAIAQKHSREWIIPAKVAEREFPGGKPEVRDFVDWWCAGHEEVHNLPGSSKLRGYVEAWRRDRRKQAEAQAAEQRQREQAEVECIAHEQQREAEFQERRFWMGLTLDERRQLLKRDPVRAVRLSWSLVNPSQSQARHADLEKLNPEYRSLPDEQRKALETQLCEQWLAREYDEQKNRAVLTVA